MGYSTYQDYSLLRVRTPGSFEAHCPGSIKKIRSPEQLCADELVGRGNKD